MTSTQQLNKELFTALAEIAQDESMMRKAVKALKRIIKKSQENDPTLMTKDEFFARIEEASKGPSYTLLPGETVEDLIARVN